MRTLDHTPIAQLRNLGPASARMLASIGVTTRGDLERVGPVLAYRALKDTHAGVSLNLLYAMHGTLTDQRWDQLSASTRERLKRKAKAAQRVPPRRG